jgi:hypothetical protein
VSHVQVERGVVSFVEKARHAQAAGAACVLVINSEDADYMPLGMQSDPGDDINIPVVCVRSSCAALLDAQQSAAVTLRFQVDGAAAVHPAAAAEHGGDGVGEGGGLATPVQDSTAYSYDRSARTAAAGGVEIPGDGEQMRRQTVVQAYTLTLVFDTVRSYSTDGFWRDVQVDALGSSVAEEPPQPVTAGELGGGMDSGKSQQTPARSLHRVVDFSNLVLYACGNTIVDGLDFSLRVKIRPAPESLRSLDVTVPAIRLSLSNHQVQLLQRWSEWIQACSVPTTPTQAGQAEGHPDCDTSTLATDGEDEPHDRATAGAITARQAEEESELVSTGPQSRSSDGSDSAAAADPATGSWLGWIWDVVAGPDEQGDEEEEDEEMHSGASAGRHHPLLPSARGSTTSSDETAQKLLPRPFPRYRALCPAQIRESWKLSSGKLGRVEAGEVVVATAQATEADVTRVQIEAGGWVSVRSRTGKLLLELLPDQALSSTAAPGLGSGGDQSRPAAGFSVAGGSLPPTTGQQRREYDTQHEQVLASISSAYRSSQFTLLLYVTEFEITLRHEQQHTCQPMVVAQPHHPDGVAADGHSPLQTTPARQQATVRAQAEFFLLRFHDLLLDHRSASQPGPGAPPTELSISSTFVDGFRLEKHGSSSPSPPKRVPVLVSDDHFPPSRGCCEL